MRRDEVEGICAKAEPDGQAYFQKKGQMSPTEDIPRPATLSAADV